MDVDRTALLPEAYPSQPIRYIDRTRANYRALGYEPYRWPHFDRVPFAPLTKPLAQSRVLLVTTAAPFRPELGDQGPGAPYNGAAKFFEVFTGATEVDHDLRISHIGYDRNHTTAEDPNTWFPLPRLREAVAAGRIGALTERFAGVPTLRGDRVTLTEHAPEVLEVARADGADVALLVPV